MAALRSLTARFARTKAPGCEPWVLSLGPDHVRERLLSDHGAEAKRGMGRCEQHALGERMQRAVADGYGAGPRCEWGVVGTTARDRQIT